MRYVIFLLLSFAVTAGENRTPHRIRVTPDHDNVTGFQNTAEINIYQGATYENVFLEWESIDGLTIGAYFNNIPLRVGSGYRQSYVDDSYLGVSKWWGERGGVRFGLASQLGTQLGDSTSQNFFAITMAHVQFTPIKNFTVSAGPWWANNATTLVGNYTGATVTLGWKISDDVRIEGNWYSGRTNLSGAVVNAFWSVNPHLETYIGIQVPATNSGNEFAGIMGFSTHLIEE